MALNKPKQKPASKKAKTPKLNKELTEKQRLLVGAVFMLLGVGIFISLAY